MSKKMLIDATHAEETRVVVVDGNKVEEFDFESENKRQLAGNIYLAKVTRVEPSLQAAFVDYGGNRHGFLTFSEIHPDYYQIPVTDREKLLAEEAEYARSLAEEDNREKPKSRSRRSNRSRKSEAASDGAPSKSDDVVTGEVIDADVIEVDETDTGLVEVPEAQVSDAEAQAEEPVAEDKSPESETEEAGAEEAVEGAVEAAEEDAAPDAKEPSEDSPADKNADSVEAEAASEDETVAVDEPETLEEDDSDDEVRSEVRRRKPRPRRYKIQEVVKVRQILLVQVVKEERGNKGAALTTYLSLAGRYCVLMPNTARGGGISRKITNAADRKKLKEIANQIEVPEGAGLIIRTAGARRTKTDIKRDYEYLLRQWEQVRELTLKSIAPAAIYEEGNLIKRTIRDLFNREIEEVFVEGEAGFKIAKEYMQMLMPNHASRVKHYTENMPLFARYQVENYLDGMFNPVVQLKSGGYIVIGITEALVAIDVNSGKATKEGSIEDTAVRTNLEAAEEVARQLKLRDLAGLIVIDFIDMEERRNNNAVEKRIKDRLKSDRARIQVGRISGFGLMEMSRQRLRPGMLEATTQPCPACHGTGLVRSDDSLALSILRELEEEGTRRRSREVLVTAPVSIANYLLNEKRESIAAIEGRTGLSIRVIGDPHLITPEFKLERFKTSTRKVVKAPDSSPITIDSVEPFEMDSEDEAVEVTDTEQQPKKKRRRRRRRGGKDRQEQHQNEEAVASSDTEDDSEAVTGAAADTPEVSEPEADVAEATETEDKPKKKRASRSRSKKADKEAAEKSADEDVVSKDADPQAEEAEEKPKKAAKKPRKPRKTAAQKAEEAAAAEGATEAEAPVEAVEEVAEKPKKPRKPRKTAKQKAEAEAAPVEQPAEPAPEPVAAEAAPVEEVVAEAAPVAPKSDKPKRSGWWSRAIGK